MNKKTAKVIQQIHDSVPKEWRDQVVTQEYVAPDLRLQVRETVKEMREEAEQLTGEKREKALKEVQRLQNIIDAGYYDAKEWRVNPEVAKKIEEYIDAELDKAIAEGRIPHPKNDKGYQDYKRKLKQHEQRYRKSALRRVESGARGEGRSGQAD